MENQPPIENTDAPPLLDKVVRLAQLLDLYGGLLTDRQREFMVLHYEEDLSFGEVARMHDVSRQAVHDAVKHAEAALEGYEEKLNLLGKGFVRPNTTAEEETPAEVTSASKSSSPSEISGTVPASEELRNAIASLKELHERMKRSGGILYNADGITREIGGVIDQLDGLLDHNNQESC